MIGRERKSRRDAMIIVTGSSKHLAAWRGVGEKKKKLASQEQPNKQMNKEEQTKQCGTK